MWPAWALRGLRPALRNLRRVRANHDIRTDAFVHVSGRHHDSVGGFCKLAHLRSLPGDGKMRCEECQGFGTVKPYDKGADVPKDAIVPCPECNGTGFAHCCEGGRCNLPDRMLD